ncbi:MAG TPA: tetratricopeptide repeat protein [Pseudolabrys sp.]|nr:tetratricopeptide repeat protein [Pseudolabrys sp.]
MAIRSLYLLAACLPVLAVAGCAGDHAFPSAPDPIAANTPSTIEQPGDIKYYPSDEPLRLAIQHFNAGHYGIAERYFRDAVEKSPKDATAWVGLAACYDRNRRFDLADRAYAAAVRLEGETVDILNNEGYSYMLRGDLKAARAKFALAYKRDPTNPTVVNNLKLLDESARYIRRE